MRVKNCQEWFVFSVAVALFVSSVFIFLAAGTSTSRSLSNADALLYLPGKVVFFATGALFVFVSAFLLVSRQVRAQLILVAWLACNLMVYHLGTAYYNEPNLFVCLGNLTDWIPVHPKTLNAIALVVIMWMLAGSLMLLVMDWVTRRRIAAVAESVSDDTGGGSETACAR